jgi:septal ring factor EnvC (AmiA/AmiB activator)
MNSKTNINDRLLPGWKIAAMVLALLCVLVMSFQSEAQSKKELQRQRDEINEKIELTKKLIRESEKQQTSTTRQVQMLNEQLAYREQLLSNLNDDISEIEGEIGLKNENIGELQLQVDDMKDEYGRMIYNAYRHRNSYDKLMYIFASDDFHQAYKRFKMVQRYAEARKKQTMMISGTQQEIKANVEELEKNKQEKETLAGKKEKEKEQMAVNRADQQKKLSDLKKEEQKLRDQQKKQKADRDKLTSKIQEVIAEEIRKENERKEANSNKSATSGATASTSSASGKVTKTAVALAPETVLINTDFEKNKGVLPWPVSAGVITSHFGKHAHPTLEQVIVNNNGVDFTAEKNAAALAVFGGTVTSVFNIPGAGQNVIITHGSYKTVYSGLAEVYVKTGDKVTTRQKLGTIMYDGEEYSLHFEVWKVGSESGSAQNPELWVKKR